MFLTKLIKLWLKVRPRIGLKCYHPLEYQKLGQPIIVDNKMFMNTIHQTCEYCGVKGIVRNLNRFSPRT